MLSFSPSMSRREVVVRGVLAVAIGAALTVWPAITVGTVVVLFAVFVFADAIASTAQLFRDGQSTGDRLLLGLRAFLEIVAGAVAIAYPGVTVSIMTVIVGIFAIATGVNELTGSRRLSLLGAPGTGWLAVEGVLAVMTGVALVVWPSIGAVTLAIVFGLYLAISGLVLLLSAAVSPRVAPSEA
jgi:uncharacterized membrane protein HdeD (DUF308 family)